MIKHQRTHTQILAIVGGFCFTLSSASWAAVAPVAHWNMDEASGASAALDSIGPADAVAGSAGNLPTAGAAGILNGAWSFDESNDNRLAVDASLGNNAAFVNLGLPTGFSYSGWIKTSHDTTPDTIFSISDAAAGSEEAALRVVEGNIDFLGRHNSLDNVTITTSTFVANGEWRHIAFTSDASGSVLYVDGLVAGTSAFGVDIKTFTTNNNNVSVNFGANNDNGGGLQWEYAGLIDEFTVYEGALGELEVEFLANNPGAIIPEPTSLTLFAMIGGLLIVHRR